MSIEIILILYVFFSAKLAAAAAEKVANADGDLQDEHNRQFMNATEVTATNKNALFDAQPLTILARLKCSANPNWTIFSIAILFFYEATKR